MSATSAVSEIMLRMRVFSLWMTAREKDVARIDADLDAQFDDIENVLLQQRDHAAALHKLSCERATRILAQQAEIRTLRRELALAALRAAAVADAHKMEVLHRERAAHYAAIGKRPDR